MAKQLFANNAKGKLNAGINNIVTALTLQAGQGALFPAIAGGDWFMTTLVKTTGEIEVIKVTQRTGDVFDTIVRAQEGTGALTFLTNDKVELRWTKGSAEALRDNLSAPAGTRMSFQQTAAPTFWTKEVGAAYNDAALRLVTGAVTPTGGADLFSAVFGVGKTTLGHALTQAELPNCVFPVTDPGHLHARGEFTGLNLIGGGSTAFVRLNNGTPAVDTAVAATGIGVSSGGSDTPHTHGLTANIKYADFIIATKD